MEMRIRFNNDKYYTKSVITDDIKQLVTRHAHHVFDIGDIVIAEGKERIISIQNHGGITIDCLRIKEPIRVIQRTIEQGMTYHIFQKATLY